MKKVFQFVILVCVVMFLQSCYSRVDGCLDPEAINYSITGDDPCDECCTYPTVKVNIYHQNADTAFFLQDTLVNDYNQQYSIIKFVYLLSDFKLKTADGEIHEVSDSVRLNVADGTEVVKDDVIRVERGSFGFEFGTIIFDGLVDELSFNIGLDERLNKNDFTSAISNHPLTTDPDSLYQEDIEEYVFQRIQVAQGVDFQDTVIYDVVGQDNVQSIRFPINVESIRGENKTLPIQARYNFWFDQVNFETMSKSEIESIIALQSATMFSEYE